jgi:protein-arginine kinase activator protein McsA
MWPIKGYHREKGKGTEGVRKWTFIIIIQMNRREYIQDRIKNLKGLVQYMIRIGEMDMVRGVRDTINKLDRELEGMKKTNRWYE